MRFEADLIYRNILLIIQGIKLCRIKRVREYEENVECAICTMQQLFLQQSLVKLSLDTRGKHPHISKLSAEPLLDLSATPSTTFRRKHSGSLDPREPLQGGP